MFKIPVIFNCNINLSSFSIHGCITIEAGKGICSAALEFDRKTLPHGFEPEILSYVSITGYPSASKMFGNAQNLFNEEKVEFKTFRTIDMGKYGSLKTLYFSEKRGTTEEKITFNVDGNVNIPDRIIDISPISELWFPSQQAGMFKGETTFNWTLKNNLKVYGYAETKCILETNSILTSKQMRLITFNLICNENSFVQNETIRLYDYDEWEKNICCDIAI